MRLVAALLFMAILPLFAPGGGDVPAPTPEEQTLLAAGLSTDGPSLLEFFRQRAQTTSSGDQLLLLARKLGDPSSEVRAKAGAEMLATGPSAIPALRHVLNDLENPVASDQAQRCLEWLEGSRRSEVPIAAARVLVIRKPAGTAEVLLAYLPFADDRAVIDGVKGALVTLVSSAAKPDPAVVKALHDPVPLRRAIAVEVLCSIGQPEVLPDVRKLLADPQPQVRLRAALALAERQDVEAIGVLIDLLAELPANQRRPAEEALQQIAGEWSPNPALQGDDEVSRKIRRDAWAAWWQNTDGPSLLAAFRKRTLSQQDVATVLALIEKLGDKVFSVRERAVADLVALGPKARPMLQDATQSPDLERAQRAALCLKQIAQGDDKFRLPAAAARLMALRSPPGATEALLAYLPFTEDEMMRGEIGAALKHIAVASGKPDPVLAKTLNDKLALRRAMAAEILAAMGPPANLLPEIRKLLKDKEPKVRLRVAVALTYAKDKDAVPALIELVADLPKGQAWEAEELLHRLAGAKAPTGTTTDDSAGRKKFREDWTAWWKDNAAAVDLSQLKATTAYLGYTLVSEVADNGNGRVVELDRAGKVRWQINNLSFPVDAWLLPGNHVLVAECNANKVTERDAKGAMIWQLDKLQSNVVNVQRLANGNTFIAVYGSPIMEVDREGKKIYSFSVAGGVQAARKIPNGQIICLTQQGACVRLDATGKELKRFPLLRTNSWTSGIDFTPKGNILVAQGDNMITEYDLDGKVVAQTKATNNTSATRLHNGHTLVASYNSQSVVELDSTGRVVWEYRRPPGYHPFRARQR